MKFAHNRHIVIAAVTFVGGWRGVDGQYATANTPLDYVDPLIGTINGGIVVRIDKVEVKRELINCRPCIPRCNITIR
jgi:hypothetical protein